ncbi:Csu type fimbrial protein [Asticcacaulis machinosus]|uniref:Spore coat U domain-containing protein n=1 Tax=Asticcacaulis machinosus TaxID=2984211 RepID=A0ABT5HNB7_9CAUL|nr:spore coat U domain-containing protein [Asticcacaulis machinosus]MDC7677513.1 spore coat U domain-containing protein [Asticcacaulis machinosus]
MHTVISPGLMALAAGIMLANTAQAQSQATSCNLNSADIDFGQYNFVDATARTAIGKVVVNCQPVPPMGMVIKVSAGFSGQPLDRYMTNGNHRLRYNLYADPAHQVVAGNGLGGTQPLSRPPSRELGPVTYRIFGMIPPRQAVPAGGYYDTLIIEVEF